MIWALLAAIVVFDLFAFAWLVVYSPPDPRQGGPW